MDLLTKPDKIQNIVACLDETLQKIESGEISIRFRLAKNPYELREDVADLLKERISYPLAEKVDVLTEDFITSDEIDYVLSSGSGFAQGSFRIYDFYQKDHTVKEAADFLKRNMEPVVPTLRWRVRITVIRIMTQKVSVWEKGTSSHRMRKCFYPGMWLQSGLKN